MRRILNILTIRYHLKETHDMQEHFEEVAMMEDLEEVSHLALMQSNNNITRRMHLIMDIVSEVDLKCMMATLQIKRIHT